MAAASCFSSSTPITGRDTEVYVAAVPLRASNGPAQLLASGAYTLKSNWAWDLQHFMVLLKPNSPPPHQVLVYDFQPEDPENIMVAAAALSGQKVSGVILVRKLSKLPTRKCWFVGYSKKNAIEIVVKFNESWDTGLRIGHHDCRNYCEGLVECLTDQKAVLEHLRKNNDVIQFEQQKNSIFLLLYYKYFIFRILNFYFFLN